VSTGRVAPLTVVVLTFNEERNLTRCLESVAGWVSQVVVVDSGSTDATTAIAQTFGAVVVTHRFESHARQWEWALSVPPITSEWVLALDADQWATAELREDLARRLLSWTGPAAPTGGYVNRRQIFRGRWIRHGGYYPKYLLKLFRLGHVRVDETDLVDHHFRVDGPTVRLAGDLIEDNRNEQDISVWIDKHNRYAVAQALEEEQRSSGSNRADAGRFFGSPDQRVTWQKRRWNQLPLYARPFAYFLYRYVVRLGFLDGKEGFVFHFLQAFWYRLLVDINRDELRRRHVSAGAAAADEAEKVFR
jgi:glycosyltransferase involved in cell wall biosynthesis